MKVPDVYFDPNAAHALVQSDNSIFVIASMEVAHDLYFNELHVKKAENPPGTSHLPAIPDGHVHQLGHTFAKLAEECVRPQWSCTARAADGV